MKNLLVYPVVLHPEKNDYFVEVPDIESGFTQGKDIKNAIEMASEMIGLMLEDKQEYPVASKIEDIPSQKGDIKTIVSVDIDEFRRNNPKTVRKNVSIPEYLVKLGKEKNINFSALLTEALKAKLEI
ncbi:HicB family protein [Ligilactobacillus pobuzihii]|uniref:type II toxin-antitoxin system HicB family antitoxin n=1 Tax=Ligilactobacillus pobuzihii TaxID=449659 RepID=UPI0019D27EF7|nr:type II toxin-antitoxin system HicB family antitoxin [Ligilactobacillus pobuzihii]MBN7275446.1 HicB family protein [Ligilactobacillus pobuzihii]